MKNRRNILRLGGAMALLASLALAGSMVLAAEEPAKSLATEAPPAAPPAPAQTAAAAPALPKPDPNGAATGGIGDISAKVAGKPTLEEVPTPSATTRSRSTSSGRWWPASWSCSCRPGSPWWRPGFVRAKNAAHTMMMNFMVYGIGMLGLLGHADSPPDGGVGASPPSAARAG